MTTPNTTVSPGGGSSIWQRRYFTIANCICLVLLLNIGLGAEGATPSTSPKPKSPPPKPKSPSPRKPSPPPKPSPSPKPSPKLPPLPAPKPPPSPAPKPLASPPRPPSPKPPPKIKPPSPRRSPPLPSPPPRPPSRLRDIRLFGGDPRRVAPVEPNLCPIDDIECLLNPSRVELRVYDPASQALVWAPLCAVDDVMHLDLANLVCKQVYDDLLIQSSSYIIQSDFFSQLSFDVPQGSGFAPNEFDPSRFSSWVTVTGGVTSNAFAVQDLQLQVSSQPCASGKILAVKCNILLKRR